MRRRILTALAVLSIVASIVPASADVGYRDVPTLLLNSANRYVPGPVGVPQDLSFVFGPYLVPPGQDSNRITIDLPLTTGFMVAVAPDLVDATNGRIPTQQEAHIHHAHWFRVSENPDYDYYTDFGGGKGLSWVFGTGEEKTQGRLADRARMEPESNDWSYGIPADGSEPNAMIYMIHNKLITVGRYFVVLDVTFIPGTRAEILAATGHDIHPLHSQLWGQTKDVTGVSKKIGARWTVTRDGMGIAAGGHLHPGGKATIVSNLGPDLDPGTAVHPACEGIDPDHDGFDGVAILNSFKFDRDMNAWPYSENYQMGATKFGWRAPLHRGDILEQQATYALDAMPATATGLFDRGSRDVLDHNWYEAMSYTGIYYDAEQSPGTPAGECTMAALAPHLLGDDTFEAQGVSSSWMDENGAVKPALTADIDEIHEDWNLFSPPAGYAGSAAQWTAVHGMVNHVWQGAPEPLCAQPNMPGLAGKPPCGPSDVATIVGPVTDTITAAGFAYVPGDLNYGIKNPEDLEDEQPVRVIPAVVQGSTITFVNADTSMNVRHTFTSCRWPCVGTYTSNFPLPNGGAFAFDTGKIGNVDYIDGGLEVEEVVTGQETDTVPYYRFTVNLPIGQYSYFCRIHPFMQGGFQVVSA